MPIRYYRRASSIACAETPEAVRRLRKAGYRRIPYAEYRERWQAQDSQTYAALRALVPDPEDTRHRIIGATPGVIYPMKETGL